MAKPRISTFLNWSADELDTIAAVGDLDIQEALLFAEEADGEGIQFLRSTVDEGREIFKQGGDDDPSPIEVETGA